MSTAVAAPVAWPSSRILRVVAAVSAGWAVVYLWPLLDGSQGATFGTVDITLRLAATVLASTAALLAALRSAGTQRWAWASLAAGANLWAATQAIHWGYELGTPGSAPAGLAVLGSAAFGLAAVLAVTQLLLARAPVTGRRAALDVALVVLPVVLVAWSAGLGELLAGGDRAPPVVAPSANQPAAQPAARLVLDALVVTLTCLLLARRPRPRALPVLGGGLVALAVADALVVAFSVRLAQVPERVVGLVTCAGLTLLAVAALTGTTDDDSDPPAATPSVLPAVMPAVAGLVVLVTVLVGEPLDWTEAALLLVLGALALVRQQLAVREANERLGQIARQEAEMRHLAFHDELTGLANRALFLDRLEHALELHRRYRRPLVVLFCDLDDFKAVNDSHGHLAGDEVLRVVAARLSTTLRPADTFARLGGDEFAVLLEQDTDAAAVARRMRTALETPFRLGIHSVTVGLTIGMARVDALEPTPDATDLLQRADADMYSAKRSPAGPRLIPAQDPRIPAPPPAPVAEPPRPEAVLHAFARDVRAGLVDVVYQPLVDPSTGAVLGLEALARWSYGGKPVLPGTFIPLAERAGLIAALTDLVLDRACAQLRAWSVALGHDRLTVSVNVSAEQMLDRDFPQRVTDALERHGVSRDQLVLELTADALAKDPATAYAVSGLLREAGVLLSLGEFTHDPVALGHLQRLPLDSIKLDGDDTGSMPGGSGQERVMRACYSLARELDLRVVVEGVERAEQLTVVRRIGGLLVQGFLLARPAPPAQLDDMVLHGLRLPD